MSPEASEFPLGYYTRLSIKQSSVTRQFPLSARTQRIICKLTGKGSWTVNTCGQDQLVFFHGQATEARVSGARVLVTWGREDREDGERLVLQHNIRDLMILEKPCSPRTVHQRGGLEEQRHLEAKDLASLEGTQESSQKVGCVIQEV